jgi:hypothetical protein
VKTKDLNALVCSNAERPVLLTADSALELWNYDSCYSPGSASAVRRFFEGLQHQDWKALTKYNTCIGAKGTRMSPKNQVSQATVAVPLFRSSAEA